MLQQEKELDELLEEKYLLEQKLKKESLLRTEMQEFLGNIYHSCKHMLEEEHDKLEAQQIIQNLVHNLEDFAEQYNIRL